MLPIQVQLQNIVSQYCEIFPERLFQVTVYWNSQEVGVGAVGRNCLQTLSNLLSLWSKYVLWLVPPPSPGYVTWRP